MPLLLRPVWLIPASIGLICGGAAATLTSGSAHRSRRRSSITACTPRRAGAGALVAAAGCARSRPHWLLSPTPNWIVGSSASGGAMKPSPAAMPPRMPSAAISGMMLGLLNVPVMLIGAGSEPMVKCFASVFSR